MPSGLTVRRVGSASAGVVLTIVLEAFGSRPPLDPPADALRETEDSIATRLALGGGLVARFDDEPVGALLMDAVGDTLYLRRFGVLTKARGTGVAAALVQAAVEAAATSTSNYRRLSVVAREELPETIGFWRHRGFEQTDRRTPYVELARALPTVHDVATADDMRALGGRVARDLRAGDLLVLSGELGAGKTTFVEGVGRAMGVEGVATSPSASTAHEHAASGTGPGLVHVDAHHLDHAKPPAGLADLTALADLDVPAGEAVTVVEWGKGHAEGLGDSRLEIRISRLPHDAGDSEPRSVEITGLGPRWAAVWPVA